MNDELVDYNLQIPQNNFYIDVLLPLQFDEEPIVNDRQNFGHKINIHFEHFPPMNVHLNGQLIDLDHEIICHKLSKDIF